MGLSSLASPCSATGAHRRLGQHAEDTHLSFGLGPLTKGGLQVRVLGLAFGQRLLPLGLCLSEVDRQIPLKYSYTSGSSITVLSPATCRSVTVPSSS